ncbi:DNA repair protein RecO [Thiorhodospira sibirica]|uniref:DNA repair protein RecO n=1 Tax=Thiorhodospira sibirica TaxID=154347 RepID=UPI00022C586E|nr:DNA repair protein RecO C-terminal domain-containing protein [Thiorhodospira sibirica]
MAEPGGRAYRLHGGSRQTGRCTLFTRYLFSVRGRGELPTLQQPEEQQVFVLQRERLWCGLYLNELALKLLPRLAPEAEFFAHYAACVADLANPEYPMTDTLRAYELGLLRVLGSGLEFIDPDTLHAHAWYVFEPQQGLREARVSEQGEAHCIRGDALGALLTLRFHDALQRAQVKYFLRHVIAHYLHGKPLMTRQLFTTKHGL